MRILFSVHGYKPAWRIGGPAISVPALAEGLVQRGHDVTVFTTNSNQDANLDVCTDKIVDVDGVKVRYFSREEPLKRFLPNIKYFNQSIGSLYAPEMSEALQKISSSIDVMHTHLPFIYPTLATARAAKRGGIPLFYHQRGVLDPERLKFRGLKKKVYLSLIEKPILRQVTTLIALTEAERESYAALGISNTCRVIPNGIDLPDIRVDKLDAIAAENFNIEARHQVILFMGRLHPIKGVDRLVVAFERVASKFPNALLVLAGPDEYGIERDFFMRAQARGLTQRVRFPGMVSGLLKSALLHRADLFCLPSDAEGFSMAILEALAHKTAVLISPRCFFPEVEKFGAGMIVDATIDGVEMGLNKLLPQPDLLKFMGKSGYDLVKERYTWNRVADMMIDAYEEGVNRFNFFKNRA
jgi:glycosyltransferase involved in cell wall biosynthesis